jgi:hypothetical protein
MTVTVSTILGILQVNAKGGNFHVRVDTAFLPVGHKLLKLLSLEIAVLSTLGLPLYLGQIQPITRHFETSSVLTH